jgi:hypothetical protein
MGNRKNKFNIPITIDVPPEVSSEINIRVAEDVTYTSMRTKSIAQTYNNPKITNLRKVGEYLLANWMRGELDTKAISRKLGIEENSVKILIAELNFFTEFPLKMIPVRGKPGFIQNSLKDFELTEKYLRKKSRTIATMEQVYKNVDSRLRVKKEEPSKERIRNKNENKEINEERSEDE